MWVEGGGHSRHGSLAGHGRCPKEIKLRLEGESPPAKD